MPIKRCSDSGITNKAEMEDKKVLQGLLKTHFVLEKISALRITLFKASPMFRLNHAISSEDAGSSL